MKSKHLDDLLIAPHQAVVGIDVEKTCGPLNPSPCMVGRDCPSASKRQTPVIAWIQQQNQWVGAVNEIGGCQGARISQIIFSLSLENALIKATSRWHAGNEVEGQQGLWSLPYTQKIAEEQQEQR